MKARNFRCNNLNLNCLDYGSEGKPPLLFVHGGSAHAHWWDLVASRLVVDYHALALDQRGHGDSDWSTDWAYGTRHYVSDLHQLVLTWPFGPPVLIGHSMGAHNAMVFAARYGKTLRGVVIIDAAPDYPQAAVDYLRTLADRPAAKFASLAAACAKFRLLPRETLAPAEVLAHVARHTFKRTAEGTWTHKIDRRTMVREMIQGFADLPNITCPALIVKITNSPALPRGVAHQMAAAIPDAQVAEIADSYHHVMLDNPNALVATLREFLKSIE
ncbi:MAG TPA: alpha/beta hydrolase [Candidatus Binataceae bacterium]|jgi:pimeloyl-ACP methyl ester carboxylesterase